mgnify:CR=1 FL=1
MGALVPCGMPGLDSPDTYWKLYDSIDDATRTIDLPHRYLADTRPDVAIIRIGDEGVEDILSRVK